jgi:DNA-binding MarR family transcriptional regulator
LSVSLIGNTNMSSFNPERHLTNVDSKIVAALEKISEVFRVLLWAGAKEYKVSPIQLQLLIFLKYHNAEKYCKVAFLAKEFNLTKATISDSIKTLELKELIHRTPDPNDSRSFSFSLTDKGKHVAENVENFTGPLDGAIASLLPTQKEYLLTSVLDLIYKLNKQGIISTQRMCFTCGYYGGNRGDYHYCNLMQKPLTLDEVRLDCAEHLKGNEKVKVKTEE